MQKKHDENLKKKLEEDKRYELRAQQQKIQREEYNRRVEEQRRRQRSAERIRREKLEEQERQRKLRLEKIAQARKGHVDRLEKARQYKGLPMLLVKQHLEQAANQDENKQNNSVVATAPKNHIEIGQCLQLPQIDKAKDRQLSHVRVKHSHDCNQVYRNKIANNQILNKEGLEVPSGLIVEIGKPKIEILGKNNVQLQNQAPNQPPKNNQ